MFRIREIRTDRRDTHFKHYNYTHSFIHTASDQYTHNMGNDFCQKKGYQLIHVSGLIHVFENVSKPLSAL